MTWIRFVLMLYFFMVAQKAACQTLSKAFLKCMVPAGSPSCGGDVKVCVFDINQLSLPTPFTVLLSISLLWPFHLYFIP